MNAIDTPIDPRTLTPADMAARGYQRRIADQEALAMARGMLS